MVTNDLLPKDKHDNSNLEVISRLNDAEFIAIIYDLFLYDMGGKK